MSPLSGRPRFKDLDFPFEPVTKIHAGSFGIKMGLDTGPELHRVAKITAETKGRISSDAPLPPADLVDPHNGDADVVSQPVLADMQRFQKFFQQYFAGMNRRKISHIGHLNDNL